MQHTTRPPQPLWFGVVTLLPEMFACISEYGITGKAIQRRLVEMHTWNPRDFTTGTHKTVDDKLFGGGPGMLLMAEPVLAALAAAKAQAPENIKTAYLTPQGRQLTQQDVSLISQSEGLILLAGRYEGIDERIIELGVDEEWSIGDYVLSGGELPAMVLMDAVIRLLPDAVGNAASVEAETFNHNLLDCPHFTRPRQINNLAVPEVLLSGDHQAIARWRLQQSLIRTLQRRPDLLARKSLSELEKALLEEYMQQQDQ